VSDGGNENVVCPYAIQNGVRKPIEKRTVARLAYPAAIAAVLRLCSDCVIDFESERLSSNFAALAIPILRFSQFLIGLAMKPDPHHARRNNLALISSHGMG
jgi:hypothetical protein